MVHTAADLSAMRALGSAAKGRLSLDGGGGETTFTSQGSHTASASGKNILLTFLQVLETRNPKFRSWQGHSASLQALGKHSPGSPLAAAEGFG